MKQRLNYALQIGEVKGKLGIPIRNFQVEKQVIERAKAAAQEMAISPELVTKVMELLIKESVDAQQQLKVDVPLQNSKHILVVGGGGKMGRWLVNFLRSSGHTVEVMDPSLQPREGVYDELPAHLDHDIVFVSTPLETIAHVVSDVLGRSPTGVVVDIASLKSPLLDVYRGCSASVVSMHPMFGPSVHNLYGRNLIVCEVNSKDAYNMVVELFEETLVNIVTLPLDQHDNYMLYSLGLSHVVNLIMGDVVASNEHSYLDMLNVASTTFLKQLQTTREVYSEDPRLYWAIQHNNNYRDHLYEMLMSSIGRIRDAVEHDSPSKFIELMSKVSSYLQL